ncbi:isoprenyl transferase [Thiomicrospira sp. R3]|uniref:isoprenyl transferase n=1 Tax=Thiomicrospira sp. R3 TaxID=3035472 RepID=UPI00259AEEFD|nr:isoprenyl transferase [Thiomicrospira sp. R3]WFE68344.1 isoprenyl transferase [Thiomicrospira sp. R3]
MSNLELTPPIPQHIGIIMDGNGRWAKKRFLPRYIGHQKARTAVRKTVAHCAKLGVKALTLYAFSTENWKRPADEVTKLMSLFLDALQREVAKLHQNNVRLRVIGDRSAFSDAMQKHIDQAEVLTKSNTGLALNIAANYGGRWDIVEAFKSWHQAHPDETISSLTPDAIAPYLALADLPEPDLMIRTGGEQRISNFMVWQMAYAEFYFTDRLWPDFNEADLELAIISYQQRERRFGRTSEQVAKC